MALKIRLARGGTKKRPFYRIVIAEASSPRDGRFVERIGSYNPMLPTGHENRLVLDGDLTLGDLTAFQSYIFQVDNHKTI